MAPLHPLSSYLSSITRRSPHPLTLLEASAQLSARGNPAASNPNYNPGYGVVNPTSINNNGIFALFGLIGAGLVITSIWFFFWAKNGGFHFKKGDWEEYKSTVLRRKGPNGTTLSGATKTTDLGGGSIVGSQGTMSDFADPEKGALAGGNKKGAKGRKINKNKKRPRGGGNPDPNPSRHDDDVRAYRHERPARVGGLNREPDGSYHDYTNTDMSSSLGGAQPQPAHHKSAKARNPPARQFSYSAGTEATFSVASDDSHRPLNQPNANRHSANSSPRNSRQPSPVKRAARAHQRPPHHHSERASMPGSFAEPLDFESRYGGGRGGAGPSEADIGEQVRNTKAYIHPIPGLSSSGTPRGFRRGGGGVGGRRDSLSDSDGETGTYRS